MTVTKKNQALVSVIILNWNGANDTLECVESVKKQTYKNLEIIVVDNGSQDNSVAVLEKIKGIQLIKNPANRGFTGGHIDGLQYAAGDYIFVLNNDAVVDNNYVTTAVKLLQDNPKTAVVGGRSYHWKTEKDKYNTESPFYSFQKINVVTGEGIFSSTDSGFAHKTSWVSGSAMVLRRSAIEKVGYFHEPMFAYYEESDLFARLLTNGFDIIYSPDLRIWHKLGASSSSYFQLFQLFKNRATFATRNFHGKDLIRFYRAYVSSGLRSVYHHYKKSGDDEAKVANKAFKDALSHSIATLPRHILSRRNITRSGDYPRYAQFLRSEQVGLSFVLDIRPDELFLDSSIEALRRMCFEHYDTEFLIVCKPEQVGHITKNVKRHFRNLPLRIVIDRGQSDSNPLNLAWLSASKEYVVITPNIPSLHCLNEAIEGAIQSRADAWTLKADGFVAKRKILAILGGLIHSDTRSSIDALLAFATHQHLSRRAGKEFLKTLPSATKTRVLAAIHEISDDKKINSRWHHILEKNYRLYQANNLLLFLALPGIPARLRVGRIRNTLVNAINADTKSLATELKHMNNDIVKLRHSGYNREARRSELLSKAVEGSARWKDTPVFIICRDRLSTLSKLIEWCESVGLRNIFLIDNDSIYPALIEYLSITPYQVIRTGKNIGHTVPWTEGVVKTLAYGKYYIVSDPDVIPDKDCPDDVVSNLYGIHQRYVDYEKVGLGLKTDDLPDHYALKNEVISWEEQFWKDSIEDGIYVAGVDTTFALYKPYTHNYALHPSLRTGRPYVASHLPWYVNSAKIDQEEAFYRLHASQDITSWNTDEILERYSKELQKS